MKRTLLYVIMLILLSSVGFVSHAGLEEVDIGQNYETIQQFLADKAEDHILLAIGKKGSLEEGGSTGIYGEADKESERLTKLQYNCAVEVNQDQLSGDSVDEWLPVLLPGNDVLYGYVRIACVEVVDFQPYDDTISEVRNEILKNAISYLGVKFVNHGDSLVDGLDCGHYIQNIFEMSGLETADEPNDIISTAKLVTEEEALPGDIVYYPVNNGRGHVGIYIGNGLIINSAGHAGKTYPKGGVRISCIQYRERESYSFYRIISN